MTLLRACRQPEKSFASLRGDATGDQQEHAPLSEADPLSDAIHKQVDDNEFVSVGLQKSGWSFRCRSPSSGTAVGEIRR